MSTAGHGTYSAPPQVHSFDGLLFDFDGTIVDSTDDPKVILATSHGRRSIDTLKLYDPSKANWDYVSQIEGRIPKEYGADAVEIPGARDLLKTLEDAGAPWGVVTSGTRALVAGWLDVLKLAHPKFLVVAEDVEQGKPDPQCYLLGRSRLGLGESTSILVVEDAPSGIKAGKAAGFKVVALETTHTIQQLKDAGADWIVKDLRSIGLKAVNGKVEIEIKDALQE
ncbi:2-deoxyglucose-6-phosphate phosphatase [Rasamsonia emersonii CBS 393.64]|uniref:2-deoxyglucose-6-phosphate phosphatase n=1 Tax=Rasamsonia emersonii (strain ATCC 16479 / CBS 393.64 / IMI 116815) TaxID=1408163 RepID=A0A0F4Z0I2_RASE3|nr:2-deoxyglucose-6-phosphate phosphatase [Rasamsonia emersonii CBS 393.64]KKA24014.1 2-deoxyglucose-6-phosphate phosphatase [Rasamsonia emersonii CBS 393.64]